jgi:phosphatidylglycerophosphatase GEP4
VLWPYPRCEDLEKSESQAKSLSQQLRVPVLEHRSLKPSYACASAIRSYFTHLKADELVVVGDRILTDVVLANRMRQNRAERRNAKGPLAVWITDVWQKENMFLRWVERRLVKLAENLVGRQKYDPLVERYVRRTVGSSRKETNTSIFRP